MAYETVSSFRESRGDEGQSRLQTCPSQSGLVSVLIPVGPWWIQLWSP